MSRHAVMYDFVRGLIRRQGAATSSANSPNNPTDDIHSDHSPSPKAFPSSVRPERSGISPVDSSSLRAFLADWVLEPSSHGAYSPNDIQALERVLTELKNTQPEFVSVKTEDGRSFWNTLKGRIETIIGVLDWQPFQPYMAPLTKDQVRLCWECVCILRPIGVNILLM